MEVSENSLRCKIIQLYYDEVAELGTRKNTVQLLLSVVLTCALIIPLYLGLFATGLAALKSVGVVDVIGLHTYTLGDAIFLPVVGVVVISLFLSCVVGLIVFINSIRL